MTFLHYENEDNVFFKRMTIRKPKSMSLSVDMITERYELKMVSSLVYMHNLADNVNTAWEGVIVPVSLL